MGDRVFGCTHRADGEVTLQYPLRILVRYMAKKTKKSHRSNTKISSPGKETYRVGRAPPHGQLVNNGVHIFVDDQNLFYQIANFDLGPGFRIDFGRMALEICRGPDGKARPILSAYIAGVIPDDDSFWNIASSRGFTVRRGYLGTGHRSKQDDAFLIADMVETIYAKDGPSTIILVAGDADYMPPLQKVVERGWRTVVAFVNRGVSAALEPYTHEFRTLIAQRFQHLQT